MLLLGKNGQVGYELKQTLAPLGALTALGREELDLANKQALRKTIRELKPAVIINAAAYTAVDRAETEPELAIAVNSTAPGIIAEEAARINALLVHYSTDYVFDGSKAGPYSEKDQPNPISIYGKTKLAGEQAIIRAGCRYLILRTCWVYSLRGNNFLLTMLRLAAERDELGIVKDQVGAPTGSRLIAQVTTQLLSKPGLSSSDLGLYHLAAAGETTWYGFAREIIDQAFNLGLLKKKPALKALTTAEYPTPAARPANSRLSCSRLEKQLQINLPHWQDQLSAMLQGNGKR